MNQTSRILIIDDDRTMRESLSHLLEQAGFETQSLTKAENVLQKMELQGTDVLLCDVRMPGTTGIELQHQLMDKTNVPMVFMTAHGDIDMAVKAIQDGAYSFLEKPFEPRRLINILNNAAQFKRMSDRERQLKMRLADLSGLDKILIGKTSSIKALRDEIVDLSSANANILLIGETGTGKELVAKALHNLGPRASAPFVALNCAAIPVSKFEETLFGVAGSTKGQLARVETGTLFIDELGAIPLETQAKLLRFIETREYTPLGSDNIVQADIRIVSAGDPNLEHSLQNGKFRKDLYFRLNTVPINLPPLRERRDDIVLIYLHYLKHFAETYDASSPALSADDISALMTHDWPGNVRELKNVCERQILAGRRGPASVKAALSQNNDADAPETLRESVAAFERHLISKALVSEEGRMDDVAAKLGIGRRTLNEKIVKLGLDKEKALGTAI